MDKLSSTNRYPGHYYFNKDSFLRLIGDFNKEGFVDIELKIPSNFIESKAKIRLTEFIGYEYNFKAVILIAQNPEQGATIKIIFVNDSGAAKRFNDFTFPSSQSEGPKYYVSSKSQVTLYGLTRFVKETLKKHNLNKGVEYSITKYLAFLSFVYLLLVGPVLVQDKINLSFEIKLLLIVLALVSLIVPYFYFVSVRRGLYIKNFDNPSLSFINRILKGDFRDNPIIFISTRVIAAVLTGVIGWLVVEAIKKSVFGL